MKCEKSVKSENNGDDDDGDGDSISGNIIVYVAYAST